MAEGESTRACVVCGVLFPRNGKQTLCSKACRIARGNAQAKEKRAMLTPLLTCKHCSKEFIAPANRRYCGRKCKDAARLADPIERARRRDRKRRQVVSEDQRARYAAAKREYRKKFKRNRNGEWAKRRAKSGLPPKDWVALALRSVAAICEISTRKQQRIRTCVRRADRKRQGAIRGESDDTARLKASPAKYIAALGRWRAKSFKRKTGKAMVDDGTAVAVAAKLMHARHCLYCNCALTVENRTIDHMNPLISGGVHSASNLAAACSDCNNRKGSKAFLVFVGKLDQADQRRAIAYYEKLNGKAEQLPLGLAMAA